MNCENNNNNKDEDLERYKQEVKFRDAQIETMKKDFENKGKDILKFQQKINELTAYNEDLKKFQLDKDFHINELNNLFDNKEKVKKK